MSASPDDSSEPTASVGAEIDRLVYTHQELLSSTDYVEPLVANGVTCHGGFDADGRYGSPRMLHRGPAIDAWQRRLRETGADLIEISDDLMPPQHPNAAQAKLLLRNGVREPMIRALTIVSIVEGFGAMIRDVEVPDLDELLVESFDGSALAHLRSGLFEAHARDESGYREEGGHKQMWEAARDAALENPEIPDDVLMRLMSRRGRGSRPERAFPQIDSKLERMLGFMANVFIIEIFAEAVFEWGIDVLSDPEVSAAPEVASGMVRNIQGDEKPHVAYLRTALSEARARTIRTVDGKQIAGRVVVDALLHRVLDNFTKNRPREQREDIRDSLIESMAISSNPKALLEEFDSLEVKWTRPVKTGFEPVAVA